jgi:hypothetical protein
MEKIKPAVAELDHDLLTVEAEGNYSAASEMLDELGVIRPAVKRALDNLQGVPTDIEPVFVTAEELAPSATDKPAPRPVRRRRRKAGAR